MAALPPVTHLLYLHGFRSSPQSFKARMMAERVAKSHPAVDWWCPQMSPSPRSAAELIQRGTAHWPAESMAIVGSSLGGYYATWLAEARGCRAVLLNPAVEPARDLAEYIGEHTAYHDTSVKFNFEPGYVDELHALHCGPVADPARYFLVAAKRDEVLDWREMTGRYPGAKVKLLEGSDHALSDFDRHIDEVFAFLNLV